jgi:hypothetical protein
MPGGLARRPAETLMNVIDYDKSRARNFQYVRNTVFPAVRRALAARERFSVVPDDGALTTAQVRYDSNGNFWLLNPDPLWPEATRARIVDRVLAARGLPQPGVHYRDNPGQWVEIYTTPDKQADLYQRVEISDDLVSLVHLVIVLAEGAVEFIAVTPTGCDVVKGDGYIFRLHDADRFTISLIALDANYAQARAKAAHALEMMRLKHLLPPDRS